MRLTATDIVSLYRPTPCSLRVYLRQKGVPEAEPSAFEQILRTLGQRHELESSRQPRRLRRPERRSARRAY